MISSWSIFSKVVSTTQNHAVCSESSTFIVRTSTDFVKDLIVTTCCTFLIPNSRRGTRGSSKFEVLALSYFGSFFAIFFFFFFTPFLAVYVGDLILVVSIIIYYDFDWVFSKILAIPRNHNIIGKLHAQQQRHKYTITKGRQAGTGRSVRWIRNNVEHCCR